MQTTSFAKSFPGSQLLYRKETLAAIKNPSQVFIDISVVQLGGAEWPEFSVTQIVAPGSLTSGPDLSRVLAVGFPRSIQGP